jgi:hypothetical protein
MKSSPRPCVAKQLSCSRMGRRLSPSPTQFLKAGAGVAIENISRGDLDRFLPQRSAIGRFIGSEVEWFADRVGSILGIVAEGATDGNWGYVVLRRDEQGKYRYWDLQTRIDSRDAAHSQMVRIMATTQPTGQSCSPLVG